MSDLAPAPAVETGPAAGRRAAAGDAPSDAAARAAAPAGFDHFLSASALGVALAYATLRYNLFKHVPWADWPAYTVNKALAVAAVLLIVAAVQRLVRRRRGSATLLGWAGGMALAHSLLSFALFTPRYFPRLFDGAKLSFGGGASITIGALAMAVMELGGRRAGHWSPRSRQTALALTAFAAAIHAALPALGGWFEPATWPGGMPPLTLIAFVAGTIALVAVIAGRRSHQER